MQILLSISPSQYRTLQEALHKAAQDHFTQLDKPDKFIEFSELKDELDRQSAIARKLLRDKINILAAKPCSPPSANS